MANALNEKEKEFLEQNLSLNPKDLIFKKDKADISYKKIAIYIESRNQIRKKLPNWYSNLELHYPIKLSLEQCSSEQTAEFKTSLIEKGERFADITGGFGIDTYFISKQFKESFHLELNEELSQTVAHNYSVLNSSIQTVVGNGVEFVLNSDKDFDLLYIDPARRLADKKVFRLEDCTPNLIDIQDGLLNKTKVLLSKHSPIIDINHLIDVLKHISVIYVVAYGNECKEILVIQDKRIEKEPEIISVNIKINGEIDQRTSPFKTLPISCSVNDCFKKYIYIPNVSILKANMSEFLAQEYALSKYGNHTHFYLSDTLYSDYPGRCFEIKLSETNIKKIKKEVSNQKREIICRNAHYKPDDLAKKLKIKRGNDKAFLLAGKNTKDITTFFDCIRIF